MHYGLSESFITKGNPVVEIGLNEELVSLFNRALEVAKQEKKSAQQHLSGIVMHIIGLCLYESKNIKDLTQKQNKIIENAKIIMNERVFENIYPEELSQMLDVKYTKFRRDFKSSTGLSPAKYFKGLKISKAKQLLLESSYSIKEISNMLNYSSPENFNMVFKEMTGSTPSKYRSNCRIISI